MPGLTIAELLPPLSLDHPLRASGRLPRRWPRIPSPRLRGEGRDDLVVVAARRQPKVRGRERIGLCRHRPLTFASASLPGCTTGCSRASPRLRGEGSAASGIVALLSRIGESETRIARNHRTMREDG